MLLKTSLFPLLSSPKCLRSTVYGLHRDSTPLLGMHFTASRRDLPYSVICVELKYKRLTRARSLTHLCFSLRLTVPRRALGESPQTTSTLWSGLNGNFLERVRVGESRVGFLR